MVEIQNVPVMPSDRKQLDIPCSGSDLSNCTLLISLKLYPVILFHLDLRHVTFAASAIFYSKRRFFEKFDGAK